MSVTGNNAAGAEPMSMEEIKDCLYRLDHPADRGEDHHVNERRRLIATIELLDERIREQISERRQR